MRRQRQSKGKQNAPVTQEMRARSATGCYAFPLYSRVAITSHVTTSLSISLKTSLDYLLHIEEFAPLLVTNFDDFLNEEWKTNCPFILDTLTSCLSL